MLSLIGSIIALGLIITIHEFGHFSAARLFGVGVIEFSVGMGPRLFSIVRGNTRYSLRALPFGGSCMLLGEETEAETEAESATELESENEPAEELETDMDNVSENEPETVSDQILRIDGRSYDRADQFVNKPAWQRFTVIAAGPVFNFILAFLISIFITGNYGFDKPVITEVTAGMPVAEAGIEAGDMLYALSVNDSRMTVESARDINMFMAIHEDEVNAYQAVTMFYRDMSDGGTKKRAVVTPIYDDQYNKVRFGFSYTLANGKTDGAADVILCSLYNVKYCIRSAIESVKMLAGGNVGREDVMGPVRMVAVMDETVDEAAEYGAASAFATLLNIMILLSGTIGAMNLLPLPALDGGRLLFILVEMITGRGVPKEIEARIHMAGMVLLLLLMFVILTNDISMLLFGVKG